MWSLKSGVFFKHVVDITGLPVHVCVRYLYNIIGWRVFIRCWPIIARLKAIYAFLYRLRVWKNAVRNLELQMFLGTRDQAMCYWQMPE